MCILFFSTLLTPGLSYLNWAPFIGPVRTWAHGSYPGLLGWVPGLDPNGGPLTRLAGGRAETRLRSCLISKPRQRSKELSRVSDGRFDLEISKRRSSRRRACSSPNPQGLPQEPPRVLCLQPLPLRPRLQHLNLKFSSSVASSTPNQNLNHIHFSIVYT